MKWKYRVFLHILCNSIIVKEILKLKYLIFNYVRNYVLINYVQSVLIHTCNILKSSKPLFKELHNCIKMCQNKPYFPDLLLYICDFPLRLDQN